MTCTSTELQLEIGDGNFYQIVGEPELSDRLNSHGIECSLQIIIPSNENIPRQGDIAFLTRVLGGTRTKIFGGICGQTPTAIKIKFDTISLTLNNFASVYGTTAILPNIYVNKSNTLLGHLRVICNLLDLWEVSGLSRNILDIFARDNPAIANDPFVFDYSSGGTLSQFLDKLCSEHNCFWTLEDTGAIFLSTLGSVNCNLIVQSNLYATNLAPINPFNIDDTRCAKWQSETLNYTEVEPLYSRIVVNGRNGENVTDSNVATLNPDTKRFIALADQSEYPLQQTCDEIIKFMVDAIEFYKIDFKTLADPSNPIPDAGQSPPRVVIRLEEFLAYVNPDDVPADSLVQILAITRFIRATAEDATAIAYFKSVDQGAGTGIRTHYENRPDITDQAVAQALADSLKSVLCAFNFLINFGTTKVTGWRSGQQFRAIHSARNIDYTVTISDVKIKLRNGGRDFYSINAGTVRVMSTEDVTNQQLDKLDNPIRARLPIVTEGIYAG